MLTMCHVHSELCPASGFFACASQRPPPLTSPTATTRMFDVNQPAIRRAAVQTPTTEVQGPTLWLGCSSCSRGCSKRTQKAKSHRPISSQVLQPGHLLQPEAPNQKNATRHLPETVLRTTVPIEAPPGTMRTRNVDGMLSPLQDFLQVFPRLTNRNSEKTNRSSEIFFS